LTSGASILFSSNPGQSPQQVLDKKVEHTGIVVGEDPELVSVNDFRGGYVFLVTVVRTEIDKVLGGNGTDKKVKFFPTNEVLNAFGENGKDMECNILRMAISLMELG